MWRRPTGFTLLEVMIAIGILGMIVSLIYGSISMTADSKNEVEAQNDIYQQARWALDKMDSDLGSAFVSKNKNSRSLFYAVSHNSGDGVPLDEMHFTSFSHVKYDAAARESDQAEISYFVMESPETGLMTLYRREDPAMDEYNMEGGQFYDMVEGIIAFDLRFYDGSQWLEEWDTRDPSNPNNTATGSTESQVENQDDEMINTLPLAVEVRLLVAGPRESQIAFHTKIRIVLSTIDLAAMEGDQGGGQTPGSGAGSGTGSGKTTGGSQP